MEPQWNLRLRIGTQKWDSTRQHVGSHLRRHRWSRLTWGFARRLTTVAARFVSRNASFPTKPVLPQRPDLGHLTRRAELATGTEKMQRGIIVTTLSLARDASIQPETT